MTLIINKHLVEHFSVTIKITMSLCLTELMKRENQEKVWRIVNSVFYSGSYSHKYEFVVSQIKLPDPPNIPAP